MFVFGKKTQYFLKYHDHKYQSLTILFWFYKLVTTILKEHTITWVFVYEYYITIYRNNLLKLNSYLNSYLN